MQLRSLALVCLALLPAAPPAGAALIDFETTPPALGGGVPTDDANLPLAAAYAFPGLSVSFGFDLDSDGTVESPAVFEHAGPDPSEPPNAGFAGIGGVFDAPDPALAAQLGGWFLRSPTPGAPIGRFVIQYGGTLPVTAAAGEIWDIDGSPSNTEQYRVEAFDAANALLASQNSPVGTSTGPLPSLDYKPWVFAFSGLSAGIDRIVITFIGSKTQGIGLAFNNFHPIGVPEPTAGLLGLLGLAAQAGRRRGPTLPH